MPLYHFDIEQKSLGWHQLRCGKLTASEMHRIITPTGALSKQSDGLMNRLLAEWILGEPLVSEIETDFMAAGTENEPLAVKAFEFETGLETKEVAFVEIEGRLIGCSPDRLVNNNESLEVKCVAPNTQVERLLDRDAFLKKYRPQVCTQQWILESDKSWAYSWSSKLPAVLLEIPRDETFIRKMEAAATTFVEQMLERRHQLDSRYGPFVRPDPPKPKAEWGEEYHVSEADLDVIMADIF